MLPASIQTKPGYKFDTSLQYHRVAAFNPYHQVRICKRPADRMPTALEKIRQRDWGSDKDYLAWVYNSMTAPEPKYAQPAQEKQLYPGRVGGPGGGEVLEQRVFAWMSDVHYQFSYSGASLAEVKK